MGKGLKGYLKKAIGHNVYTLTPYSLIRRKTRKSKHQPVDGQDDSNMNQEFLEDEIQDLVSAVQSKIDSLEKKCCDEKDELDWRTGCFSCGDAAAYPACKLNFRQKKKNSWRETKGKEEKTNYSRYHEDLCDDDWDHFWRLRMYFSRVQSCVEKYCDESPDTMEIDIHVPRACHLIRILQLLSLPRYSIEDVPQQIVNILSAALAGPYQQLHNRNSYVSNLRVIECHDIQITLPTMQLLRNVLLHSESLEQLHLNSCILPETTEHQLPLVQLLGDGLTNAKSIHFKVLCLPTCYFTDGSVGHLISQLASPSRTNGDVSEQFKLETLILQSTGCDQQTLTTLASWLEQPKCPLRFLDLSRCSESLDLSPLSRALKVQNRQQVEQFGSGLRRLDLAFNALSEEGIRLLADALKQEQRLQVPSAGNNHATAMSGLRSLNLAANRSGVYQTTTCRGFQYLGEALSLCHSLQYLDVSYVRFDPAALNAFCNGLAANDSITDLRIQRPRFVGFPEAGTAMGADWISSWGGTELLQHSLIPPLSPATCMEYLCQILVTSMPQLKLLDVSYSMGVPIFFFENICLIKGLEQISLLGYSDFMTPSVPSSTFGDRRDQALIRGVSKSTNIVKVFGLDGAHCGTSIDFYVRLNRGGRKYLRQPFSSSLWPRILKRSNQQADVLYHLLREGAVSVM
ncbi:unnamed protein product [Cylindrotheca closterium]|uniref:Uncharacterized protein n=1 Tax=Cylindrotheca closterium TaxID=2856 RepID=A0AAD2JJU3_9STRA|nr:unnamed protein product [Cylindrotheca closterium]